MPSSDAPHIAPDAQTHRAMPTTMRAITQDAYGSADVLRLDRIPVPAPKEGDVLVQVDAAGVDRGTAHLMRGTPYLIRALGFGLRAPKQPVPGLDLSGTVIAVGRGVTRFAAGDAVFGIGRGTLAEYALAREDKLAPAPAGLDPARAAVTAVSGLTALQALTDVGGVRPGQGVLIVGASGGVGTFAVQIAKDLGAEVTGVCSAAKAEMVRELGATNVIDYAREDFADGRRTYDLVLDIGGNSPIRRLRRALAPRGTLVIVGGEEGGRLLGGIDRQLRALALSPFVGQRLTTFVSKERHEDLERLREMIDEGRVTPVVDRTFPLDAAADGIRHLESGRARGKVAIIA